MRRFTLTISAFACAALAFCMFSAHARAAVISGAWEGSCNQRAVQLTLSQTAGHDVAGTLVLGKESFTVEGAADNATDSVNLLLSGKDGNGLLSRTCTAQLSIAAPGQMSGTILVRTMLGLKIFSGDAELQNLDLLRDFNLIIGHVQQPSNIYLFFSVQDGNGKPVTGLTEKDFEIYEDGLPVSQTESDRTIIPNPSVYTMATVLLLDLSGSILESDTLTPLKESAKAFLEKVAGDEGQQVAIYRFDGRAQIIKVIDFTKDKTDLKNAIDTLTKSYITSDTGYDDSTNLNGAVQQGLAALDAKKAAIATGDLFTGSLVAFTDGTDQAGRVSNKDAVTSVTASAHYSFTIGLGGEIDETHLKNLGKSGFAFADDAEQLNSAFDTIATTIKSESSKRYVLGYCSPKRAGDHKVTISVADHPGALSYAFNADAFTNGCDSTATPEGMELGDSGQCLFQLEPASVRKPLLVPRRVALTIVSDKVQVTKSTTVSIEGLNVVATRYRWGKLRAVVVVPPTAKKQDYQVTVNTGAEKITCFKALTVQ